MKMDLKFSFRHSHKSVFLANIVFGKKMTFQLGQSQPSHIDVWYTVRITLNSGIETHLK